MKHRFAVPALCGLLLPGLLFAGDTVNINRADASTLAEAITGVGEARAEAIVEYRKKHGPFETVEDLALVRGVGSATIEQNRDRLSVED